MARTKRLFRKKAPRWELRLYVADTSPRSVLAAGNLRKICEQHLKTDFRITIIDIIRKPAMARVRNILATPTLVHVRRTKGYDRGRHAGRHAKGTAGAWSFPG